MQTNVNIPSVKKHCLIKQVAFFGSADVDPEHPVYHDAFWVARHLAYEGKVIVDGGGPGVMDAATKGAIAGGGKTIAVTFYPKDMPEFEGRFHENIVDVEVKTANYVERMFGLMENADIFIIFEGGTGTLSEWATAWLLAHLYYGNHKPIILFGEFWKEVMTVINRHFFIGAKERQVYAIASNKDEVIEAMNRFEHELELRCELPRPQPKDTPPALV